MSGSSSTTRTLQVVCILCGFLNGRDRVLTGGRDTASPAAQRGPLPFSLSAGSLLSLNGAYSSGQAPLPASLLSPSFPSCLSGAFNSKSHLVISGFRSNKRLIETIQALLPFRGVTIFTPYKANTFACASASPPRLLVMRGTSFGESLWCLLSSSFTAFPSTSLEIGLPGENTGTVHA